MNDPPKRDVMLFAEALQLSPAERAAYLERACGADAELRQRVERLLKAHDQAGDFLEHPPAEAVVEAPPKASVGEKPGDRIGRYKLLQQIGEGGALGLWGLLAGGSRKTFGVGLATTSSGPPPTSDRATP